jgi:hypothetical protein
MGADYTVREQPGGKYSPSGQSAPWDPLEGVALWGRFPNNHNFVSKEGFFYDQS